MDCSPPPEAHAAQRPRVGWRASLALQARRDGARTIAFARHEGPLRVLKALYPEGEAVCHQVLVHPPAGIVGGDELAVSLALHEGAQLLLTTPGATRFYRSQGPLAVQALQAQVGPQARLEWLPAETLVYSGARARNAMRFSLAEGAQLIGWDLVALGLPAAGQPFVDGCYEQRLEIEGLWLDAGCIEAGDALLLDSPLGLAGQRVLATMWWAAGPGVPAALGERALELARELLATPEPAAGAAVQPGVPGGVQAGVTRLQDGLVVLRALASRTEPLQQLLRALRLRWRSQLWKAAAVEPRVWAT